jgi:hypothetical protein
MAKTSIHSPSEIEVGKIYERARHARATYLGVGRKAWGGEGFEFKSLIVLEDSGEGCVGMIVTTPEDNEEFWAEGFSLIED